MEADCLHLRQVAHPAICYDAAASERPEDIGVHLTPEAADSWRAVEVLNDDDTGFGDVEGVAPKVGSSRKLVCVTGSPDACGDRVAYERAELGKTARDRAVHIAGVIGSKPEAFYAVGDRRC